MHTFNADYKKEWFQDYKWKQDEDFVWYLEIPHLTTCSSEASVFKFSAYQ